MQGDHIEGLMAFLDNSLTSYHAVDNIRRELLQKGFTELSEKKVWSLEAGGDHFVIRNDSSVIAFRVPECDVHDIP